MRINSIFIHAINANASQLYYGDMVFALVIAVAMLLTLVVAKILVITVLVLIDENGRDRRWVPSDSYSHNRQYRFLYLSWAGGHVPGVTINCSCLAVIYMMVHAAACC